MPLSDPFCHTEYMHTHSVTQPFLTLCYPIDCSPPGSSVHGLSQAGHWSRVPFPNPEDLPHPGIKPRSLCLLQWQADSFYHCATWEVLFFLDITTKQDTENPLDSFPYLCVYFLGCYNIPLLFCPL